MKIINQITKALSDFDLDQGAKAKAVIIHAHNWEIVRLWLAENTDVMTGPTLTYEIEGVPVYGSWQLGKDEIHII